ncbi:MAG TPA: hypothetical protein VML50_02160 [Anaeromyxobacter sp.]|nr:hypothetical protein [Anaeromyxobacter sp.]
MRVRDAGQELARMLAALVWVVAASAAVLAGLGALPGWIAGEARAVARVRSVDEAERRLGARLALPAYFPQRLAWPPAAVRVAGGRGGSAAIEVAGRDGAPALLLLQATEEGGEIAAALLGERTVVSTRRAAVGSVPATLAAVLVEGRPWEELSWQVGGRAVVLRSCGGEEELFRIAHSVRREGR